MENDGTTPSKGDNGKRRALRQWLRDWRKRWAVREWRPRRNRGPLHRPMWQEPLRGALYAAGSGIIGVAFAWFQHWL